MDKQNIGVCWEIWMTKILHFKVPYTWKKNRLNNDFVDIFFMSMDSTNLFYHFAKNHTILWKQV